MPGVEILDPHAGTRNEIHGFSLEDVHGAVILLHGCRATPEDILYLAHEVDPGEIAFLAPEASGETWYPQSFSSPLETNQPYPVSAMRCVARLVVETGEAGIPFEGTVLVGFSQGVCLALEYT